MLWWGLYALGVISAPTLYLGGALGLLVGAELGYLCGHTSTFTARVRWLERRVQRLEHPFTLYPPLPDPSSMEVDK